MDLHLERMKEWEIAHKANEDMHRSLRSDFMILVSHLTWDQQHAVWYALRKALSKADGHQPFGWDHTIRDTHPGLWRLYQCLSEFHVDREDTDDDDNKQ